MTQKPKKRIIQTDILIIGAGPCGLFTVFEAGLVNLRCHLVDSLPKPGGQCAEIYPKKPIYDIPGFPSILAGDLVENLLEQIKPFKPGFTLGEKAETISKLPGGTFRLTTNKGTILEAPIIAIAAGLGCFEPRKPPLKNLHVFENSGVDYFIKDPSIYQDKTVVISGGGDSALDWSIFLAEEHNSKVYLVHRRTSFRGHPDSVRKVHELHDSGKIDLHLDAEVTGLSGTNTLSAVKVKKNEKELEIETSNWLPLFGLSPKLGPIANWELGLNKNAIEVNTLDYSTNIEGIYAIGDINSYPGKLKLILCGFHEATLMVQSAYKKINPDRNLVLKYTTVNGIQGFE